MFIYKSILLSLSVSSLFIEINIRPIAAREEISSQLQLQIASIQHLKLWIRLTYILFPDRTGAHYTLQLLLLS